MSMKVGVVLRACSLFILLFPFFPANQANAMAADAPPPVDMFQLPWDQGIAWYAIDGIDNGNKRPESSSHNYRLGGAIDFAPRTNMRTGEDTSRFWVTAAASGIVIATSNCFVSIAHDNGWTTMYQFLGNIQVKLGDVVARNQRIGIIADGVRYKYCAGYQEINIPHLHFMLRPSMIGASFAGWELKYNSFFNSTRFTKDGSTVGLFKPLMNTFSGSSSTPSPVPTQTMLPSTPTLTPPSGPYVSTVTDLLNIDVGQSSTVTVRLNNVPMEGYTSAEITCPYNAGLIEVSSIVFVDLFGTDPVMALNGPQNGSFIAAIAGASGNKATTGGAVLYFTVKGLQAGQAALECTARVSMGQNVLIALSSVGTSITVNGSSATPVPSPTATSVIQPPPASPTPVPPTQTPAVSATPAGDWLTFTNLRYGFQFGYPGGSQIASGRTDTYARINLPFIQGTNLGEKYQEVTAAENASVCQSPLATRSMLQTSETVVISGITFLKQTGGDGAAGSFYQWVAYSTSRNNICVSLDFVLHSLNPGNFATPVPIFDQAAESIVFGQIVSTYSWFTAAPTNTPAIIATGTPVPTFTATAHMSPTPSGGNAAIAGQVTATKPVIVNVYDGNAALVATVETLDGNFQLEVPPGTYTIVATAPGFLRAQSTQTINSGITRILPPISLPAGDIDSNNVIDQFDALTIGMSYNSASPAAADLNNDGLINVLDLELLARNYHKTGPLSW